MFKLKDCANDSFIVKYSNKERFQILVSRGYIFEIGDSVFLWDPVVELWNCHSAHHSWIVFPQHTPKPWKVLNKKKTIFGNEKPTSQTHTNFIQLTPEQMKKVVSYVSGKNVSFKDLYNSMSKVMTLPPYTLSEVINDSRS